MSAIKLDKQGRIKLSEADVTRQVKDFLEAEGWRAVRMNVGAMEHAKGARRFTRFGETGMPDWLFYRPTYNARAFETHGILEDTPERRADSLVMWVEMKSIDGKLSPAQKRWHEAERARGALVQVVDNYEAFCEWYAGVFG